MAQERFSLLKSNAEVQARIHELAAEISRDYAATPEDNPLLVLCTLRGAVFFSADLIRERGDRSGAAEEVIGVEPVGDLRGGKGRIGRKAAADCAGKMHVPGADEKPLHLVQRE